MNACIIHEVKNRDLCSVYGIANPLLCFKCERYTVEPLLKDTPNKGHNTLCKGQIFCGPYSIMAIQSYRTLKEDNLYNSKIKPKIVGPKVSVI